jgi:hypothetical protein
MMKWCVRISKFGVCNGIWPGEMALSRYCEEGVNEVTQDQRIKQRHLGLMWGATKDSPTFTMDIFKRRLFRCRGRRRLNFISRGFSSTGSQNICIGLVGRVCQCSVRRVYLWDRLRRRCVTGVFENFVPFVAQASVSLFVCVVGQNRFGHAWTETAWEAALTARDYCAGIMGTALLSLESKARRTKEQLTSIR